MDIVSYPDAAAFLARAEPFLLADEARHNLTLGMALAESGPSDGSAAAPFFATIEVDGSVVVAAYQRLPYALVISPSAEIEAAGDWPWLAPLARLMRRAVPGLPGTQGPPALVRAFAAEWAALGGRPARPGMSMRIHRLDEVAPLPAVPGSLRPATPADRDLVLAWMHALHDEATPDEPPIDEDWIVDVRLAESGDPMRALYLWVSPAGAPCSICGTSGPTPHGIRINAVYTPSEHRGRGYATAAVAELSRRMLAAGKRHCCLVTDLANPTSNRIYARIGYRPVCDVDEVLFG